MRRAVVAAATAVLVASCSAELPTTRPESDGIVDPQQTPLFGTCTRFHVAPASFTPEQRDALQRAATRWNQVALVQTCITDDAPTEGGFTIGMMHVGSPEYQWALDATGYEVVWGVCYDDGHILTSDEVPPDYFEAVAMHELGHCSLGMGHIREPGIMGPNLGPEISEGDMIECRRAGSCAPLAPAATPPQPAPVVRPVHSACMIMHM